MISSITGMTPKTNADIAAPMAIQTHFEGASFFFRRAGVLISPDRRMPLIDDAAALPSSSSNEIGVSWRPGDGIGVEWRRFAESALAKTCGTRRCRYRLRDARSTQVCRIWRRPVIVSPIDEGGTGHRRAAIRRTARRRPRIGQSSARSGGVPPRRFPTGRTTGLRAGRVVGQPAAHRTSATSVIGSIRDPPVS